MLTTALNVSFVNTGTLDVQTGSVFLFGGATTDAIIKTATGTAVNLTQVTTNTFEGTIAFQGSGDVLTGSGVVNIGGTGATFVVPPTTTFHWGGVINNGTIRKTVGAGTSLISTVLSKDANLTVDTGELTLGPAAGVIQGGNFNVAAGAVLNLPNGYKEIRLAVATDCVSFSASRPATFSQRRCR